jgi:hypothetical protein
MEIWFDDDLKDARFQGFFEVARSVGWLARLWITLTNYKSAQDILNAVESIECRPEEKVIITVKFKLEVLDILVFRPYNE